MNEIPLTPEQTRKRYHLEIDTDTYATFISLAKKIGLRPAITNANLIVNFERKRDRLSFTPEELELSTKLTALSEVYDLAAPSRRDNLGFRYVESNEGLSISQLVEDSRTHGGAHSESPWTHIGSGEKVLEFIEFRNANRRNAKGILFMYDMRKLVPITEDDIIEHPENRQYLHGFKPDAGLELRDALLGSITLEMDNTP